MAGRPSSSPAIAGMRLVGCLLIASSLGCGSDTLAVPERPENPAEALPSHAAAAVEAGVITLTAFISPYQADRQIARETIGAGNFFEVFCDTPLAVCEERDPKGLYKKARAGEIKGFTGIDDPYEAPEKPEMVIDTSKTSPQDAAVALCEMLEKAGKISSLSE